tara:strand:+ start:416 stop:832 length:417 start_codon:yes stop_codon:yes gene_type:complete
MADTVTVTQLNDGIRYCEYEFTNESDGTGETTITKIDLTNLVGSTGALTGGDRPTSLTFVDGDWEVNGFNYVNVLWDRQAANKLIETMVDSGGVDLFPAGGKRDPARDLDGTGDILLTTDGGADGSGYRIRMRFRKKY